MGLNRTFGTTVKSLCPLKSKTKGINLQENRQILIHAAELHRKGGYLIKLPMEKLITR